MPSYNLLSVDMPTIGRNLEKIRAHLPAQTRIMSMIKASAYGTGAHRLASFYTESGIDILGVSHTQEGVFLRKKGITNNIFVIHAPTFEAKEIVKYDLEVGLSDLAFLEALAKAAKHASKVVKVHLHIDTGMKRFGCAPEEAMGLVQAIMACPHLALEGIMTHFVAAELAEYDAYSEKQIALFKTFLSSLEEAKIKPRWVHAQNSAAAFRFTLPFCNMVRVGLAPFGYLPTLAPALTLSSTLVSLHELTQGESLGYNRAYIATRPKEKIAICPLGYHDGIQLQYSGKGYALLCGKPAPFVGRICMDFLMLDVTEIPHAKMGDSVIFFGSDAQGNTLPLEQFASFVQTNVREVMTSLGPRIKRVFT